MKRISYFFLPVMTLFFIANCVVDDDAKPFDPADNSSHDPYTLTYYTNGVTHIPLTNITVISGQQTTLHDGTGLSFSGYNFGGWTNVSGETFPGGTLFTMGNSNVDLYVKWVLVPVYSLKCYTNDEGVNPFRSISLTNGQSSVLHSGIGLYRNGYTFGGWTNAAGVLYAGSGTFTMGNADETLYVKWDIITYRLKYMANGGFGTYPPPTYGLTNGQTVTIDDGSGLYRTGFTFMGWKDNLGMVCPPGSTYTISNNSPNIYAQWSNHDPSWRYFNVTGNISALSSEAFNKIKIGIFSNQYGSQLYGIKVLIDTTNANFSLNNDNQEVSLVPLTLGTISGAGTDRTYMISFSNITDYQDKITFLAWYDDNDDDMLQMYDCYSFNASNEYIRAPLLVYTPVSTNAMVVKGGTYLSDQSGIRLWGGLSFNSTFNMCASNELFFQFQNTNN
jgi:uncharacterized repeat protein (TIGR02543 family)